MATMTSNAAKPRLTTQLTKKMQSIDITSDTIIKLDDILDHVGSMKKIWEEGSERDKNKLGTDFKKLITVIVSIKTNLNDSLKLNGNFNLATNLISNKKAQSNIDTKRQQLKVPEGKRKLPFELRISETVSQATLNQQPKKKQKKNTVNESKSQQNKKKNQDLIASKIDKFIDEFPPQVFKHYTMHEVIQSFYVNNKSPIYNKTHKT